MDEAELVFSRVVVAGAVAATATLTENSTPFRMHYYIMPGVSFVAATILTRNPVYGVVAGAGNVWLSNWNLGM